MSATTAQFALNETDRTIAAAALPTMHRSHTELAERAESLLNVKLHYHFIDEEHERLDALMIEWTPDDRLFLNPHAVNVMQKLVKVLNDAALVVEQIHTLGNELDGVYRVV